MRPSNAKEVVDPGISAQRETDDDCEQLCARSAGGEKRVAAEPSSEGEDALGWAVRRRSDPAIAAFPSVARTSGDSRLFAAIRGGETRTEVRSHRPARLEEEDETTFPDRRSAEMPDRNRGEPRCDET